MRDCISIFLKKTVKTSILLLTLLIIEVNVFGQGTSDSLRLFIIGNSFSQNASAYLPEMAKEKGKTLIVGRAELGGHSLQQHWSYAEKFEANPNDPAGKPYDGKSLNMLLSKGVWDVVTIQQYSLLSADSSSYNPYAAKLVNYIKELQPNAKIFVHQTWAYRADAKKFGQIGNGLVAENQSEMWQKSRAAYHKIANTLNARIIPVGDAFETVAKNKKYGYFKDSKYDYDNPVAPILPVQANSINVGYFWDKGKLAFDPNHANEAGKYLGGLVWFGTLFQEDVKSINFRPETISEEFAEYLRSIASKTIKTPK